MSTFKAALRVAAAHPFYILIYTFFVSLMGALIALSVAGGTDAGEQAFEPYDARVAVVDRDGSELSDALRNYLSDRYDLVDVADEDAELQDAVATGRVDCVFFVPECFGADLLSAARAGDDLPQLQEAYGVSTQASALVGVDAQRWVSLAGASAALNSGAGAERVVELTNSSAAKRANVSIRATEAFGGAVDQLTVFLKFESYAITSSVVVCVGLVLSALGEPELKSRLEAGPQASRTRALSVLSACLVLTLAVCAASSLVGLVALHEAVASLPAWQVALAFGSNFAFALVPLAIAFLLASMGAREEVLNACGNILGMVMSFMGGAWVPLSFMGPAVVAAAHFFPTYWTNSSVDAALSAPSSGLSAAGLGTYLTGMGITVLFAIAITSVGLALARARRQG